MIEAEIPAVDRLSKQTPLYVSKRSLKNLWQQYRIYADRIELQCWTLFHTLKIPFREIKDIEIRTRFSNRDTSGGRRWRSFFGLKLDMSDLCRHIAITKKLGIMRCIVFSPDNADEFADIMKLLVEKAGEISSLLERQG